jgi:hypothetical protein
MPEVVAIFTRVGLTVIYSCVGLATLHLAQMSSFGLMSQ